MVEFNENLGELLKQSFEAVELEPNRKRLIWENIVANVKPLDDAGIQTGPDFLASETTKIHRRKS